MISIRSLTKTYTNDKKNHVVALNNISLELPSKGFIYLNGKSGSGKTTLLNLLGGLNTFESGELMIDGQNISNYTQKQLDEWRGQKTAFVFQDFNLISSYTVAENIRLGKNIQGYECTNQEIEDVLKYLDLKGYESRRIKDLSGGERQRIAIARALVRSPKVLIVDEPTGQLDCENSTQILKALDAIAEKILVICVSHNEELVKKYADRIITLKEGKLIRDEVFHKIKEVKPQPIAKSKSKLIERKKHLFKLGMHNLSTSWFRTVSVVLLTCVSLLFFSTFALLSQYDRNLALANSAKLEDVPYVVFNKGTMKGSDYEAISNMSDANVYKYFAVDWYAGIKGVVAQEPLQGNATALGLTMKYGDYPVYTQANAYEVVITDYVAQRIINRNIVLRNELDVEAPFMGEMSTIVGKKIYTNDAIGEWLTIAGVVETDYSEFDNPTNIVERERLERNEENIYNVMYTSTGFAKLLLADANDEFGQTAIINDVKMLVNMLNPQVKDATVYQTVMTDATAMNWKARGTFNLTYTNGTTPYIADTMANDDVFVSKDVYDLFKSKANVGASASGKLSISFNGSAEKKFNILGIIQDAGLVNTFMFNNNDFNTEGKGLARDLLLPTTKLLLPINDLDAEKLASMIGDIQANYGFIYESSTSSHINAFSEKLEAFTVASLIFGIASLVFASFLLYYFVITLIMARRRTTAIFRSLGATSWNIACMLFITVGTVALACFALSSVLTLIVSGIINTVGQASLQVPFNIVTPSWGLFGLLLLVCGAVSFVATVFPIYKHAKQTPIQQLKG